MIIDLNTLAPGSTIHGDICLVGCGAIGMAMARELSRTSIDTIVVDGGSEDDDPQTQALYDCEMIGLPLRGATEGRFRVLGGSTTRWGGQALPMDAIDFEARDWVAHSGWPIGFDDVARHYPRAAEYMKVDSGDYGAGLAQQLRAVAPPVNSLAVRYHYSKWAPRPSLREVYIRDFRRAPHLRLFTRANVTRIDLTDNGLAVRRLIVRSLQGSCATVEARYIVLCAGGIENARLLLANDHQMRGGIGNCHDVVGRFLQDHPSARAGVIDTASPRRLQEYFNQFYWRRRRYAVRLSAAETFQRAHRTLNLSSGITFEAPPDSAFGLCKQVYQRARRGDAGLAMASELAMIGKSATSLLRPAYQYLVRGRQYVPGASYTIHVISEQEPEPSSRVSLAEVRDALGVRRARIDWRVQPSTARSIRLFARALRSEFARLGLGQLVLASWLENDEMPWQPHISDAYHHIGTTRMSHNPQCGVVQGRCTVHGIDNLYIAGSSVFPTGGHSNPTFTALALAFRTCDDLRDRLRH